MNFLTVDDLSVSFFAFQFCFLFLVAFLEFLVARAVRFWLIERLILSSFQASNEIWFYLGLCLVSGAFLAWFLQIHCARFALKVRKSLNQHIFSFTSPHSSTVFISNDAYKLETTAKNAIFLLVKPMEMAYWILLLGKREGYLVACIFTLPIVFLCSKVILLRILSNRLRLNLLRCKDRLIAYLESVFSALYTVKAHSWEECLFQRLLSHFRKPYLASLCQVVGMNGVSSLSLLLLTPISMAFAFCWFVLPEGFVDTARISRCFLIVRMMNACVFGKFLPALEGVFESRISIRRIREATGNEKCMKRLNGAGDLNPPNQSNLAFSTSSNNTANKSQFFPNQHPLSPQSLDSLIKIPQKIANIHSQSVISQVENENYSISIGYCSESPAIIDGKSIRENIILDSHPINHQLLDQVLGICQLLPDISTFPQGLDRIINVASPLSGGQAYRIAIARILYHSSEIDLFIFDQYLQGINRDCALEIHKGIFEFLKHKSVIINTKVPEFLQSCSSSFNVKQEEVNESEVFADTNEWNVSNDCVEASLGTVDSKIAENFIESESVLSANDSKKSLILDTKNSSKDSHSLDSKNPLSLNSKVSSLSRSKFIISKPTLFLTITILFALGSIPEIMKILQMLSIRNQESHTIYLKLFLGIYTSSLVRSLLLISTSLYFCNYLFHQISHHALITLSWHSFVSKVGENYILNQVAKDLFFLDEGLPDLLLECVQCCFSTGNRVFFILFLGDSRFRGIACMILALTVVFWLFTRFVLMNKLALRKQQESSTRTLLISTCRSHQKAFKCLKLMHKSQFLLHSFHQSNLSSIQASLACIQTSCGIILLVNLFCILFYVLLYVATVARHQFPKFDLFILYSTVSDLEFFLFWSLEHALTWQEYLSIGKRISQFLNISQPNEKKSVSMSLQSPPKESNLAFKLENVRFLDPPIPCSFSLSIPAGSVTWITGRTGVGKSTLFSLLLGMYHSSERGCCYSGNLQRIQNARILIVTQQPTLFARCSMRFNIDPRSLCKDDLQLFSLLSQVSLSISTPLDGEEEEGLQYLQHVSLSMRRKIGIVRLLVEASAALEAGMKVVALFDETFDDEEELLSLLFSHSSLLSNPNVTCVIITHNPRLINDENCINIG